MFVFVIFGRICRRTGKVSFDFENCAPCVAGQIEGSIDPALWYKVLALDSILIDCDHKVVYWATEKYETEEDNVDHEEFDPDKVLEFFKHNERLSKENVDLSPALTELFETAEEIFQNLSKEMLQSDGNRCLQKDLLKILHVFILPEVNFYVKHTSVLQKVLCAIEKELENVEMLITKQLQMKRNYEDSLAKQRKNYLSNDGVSGILKSTTINFDVIKQLIIHSEKDTRKLDDTIVILTDKITSLRNATDDNGLKTLADIRAERDRVTKEKEEIIFHRGELISGIKRQQKKHLEMSKRKGKKFTVTSSPEPTTDTFKEYRNETNELEKLNSDIKTAIHTKFRMVSVREATSLTLKEIKTDGSSYGYNRKQGSLTEADLFDLHKKPKDWKTLNEQIQTLLHTNMSKLQTKYTQLCTKMKKNCKELQIIPETTNNEPSGRRHFTSLYKKECEAVCKLISDDISDMADDIATEIRGNDAITQKFHTQVYICLEEHFSKEVMSDLCNLHERCFEGDCEKLSDWIEKYSTTELKAVNKIADSLFAIPFDDENYQQALDMQLRSAFETFFSEVQKAVDSSSILGKIRAITKAVQSTKETISELRAKRSQRDEICTDDILDMLIILICRLSRRDLFKLYVHMNLVLNFSPYFLEGSMNEYYLVTLSGAYQHLLEHAELHTTVMNKV